MKTSKEKKENERADGMPADIRELAVAGLTTWAGNRRMPRADGITQLAESIRRNGVLQPLLARPAASGYEIICGGRRLAAAREAQIATVPCYVRDLDDGQAAAAVAAENLIREDFAPLDAYIAVKATLDAYGTPEAAADALAKPAAWVRRVASLERLTGPWYQTALAAELALPFLIELARLPQTIQDSLHAEYQEALTQEDGGDLPMLRRIASRMQAAIPTCAWLASDKGCETCAKRTDAERWLFPDLTSDMPQCLDPACREDKRQAFIAAQKVKAAARAKTTPDKVATANFSRADDRRKPDAKHTVPVVIAEGCDSGTTVWREPSAGQNGTDATPKGPTPSQRLAAKHIRAVADAVHNGAVTAWTENRSRTCSDLLAAALMFGVHGEHPSTDEIVTRFRQLACDDSPETCAEIRDEIADRIVGGVIGRMHFDKVSECDGAYAWACAVADIFGIEIAAPVKGGSL